MNTTGAGENRGWQSYLRYVPVLLLAVVVATSTPGNLQDQITLCEGVCSGDPTKTCVSPSDCDGGDSCIVRKVCAANEAQTCQSDDDCAAAGPCEPVCDAADERYQGEDEAFFGFNVAMGDVCNQTKTDADSQGFDDVIIGSPADDSVYIFCGSLKSRIDQDDAARGLIALNDADIILNGTTLLQDFGFSVATSKRGTGPFPLIIGAPSTDNAVAPMAYVIPPSALDGLSGEHSVGSLSGVIVLEGASGDQTGYAVAATRTVGPTMDRFAVSARTAADGAGVVYYFSLSDLTESPISLPGSSIPRVTGTRVSVEGPGGEGGTGLGESLTFGEFWAGGLGLAIGAVGLPEYETPGRVYVIDALASPPVNLSDQSVCIEGEADADFFGYTLASGRFEGTPAQLAVGAIYAAREDLGASGRNAGAVYILQDLPAVGSWESCSSLSPDAPPALKVDPAHVVRGSAGWDQLGTALAVGKVKRDMEVVPPPVNGGMPVLYDDLLMTARWSDRTANYEDMTPDNVDEGATYVIFGGKPNGFSDWPTTTTCPLKTQDCNTQTGCLPDCSVGLPDGVDIMLMGGSFGGAKSDEVGFSVDAGDYNFDGTDEIAVASLTHNRVYLVSPENTNEDAPLDGQDADDFRNTRDEDDDGDGYLDTEEDYLSDGIVGDSESDPLEANNDITVRILSEDLPCAGTAIPVLATVENKSRRLTVEDPLLQITLDGPFMYEPDSTWIIRRRDDPVPPALIGLPEETIKVSDYCFDTVQLSYGDACSESTPCTGGNEVCTFAFLLPRSITATGEPRTGDPLAALTNEDPDERTIEVQFGLSADLTDSVTSGTVTADVSFRAGSIDDRQLPYPHESGISFEDSFTETIDLLRPDLSDPAPVKTSSYPGKGTEPGVSPLDEIVYVVTVSNTGPLATSPANYVIMDAIPADTTFVAGSMLLDGNPIPGNTGLCDDTSGTACTSRDDCNPTVDCLISVRRENLNVNASSTFTFRVQVNENAPDGTQIPNSAVLVEDCLVDPIAAVLEVPDVVTVVPAIDIEKLTNGVDADDPTGPIIAKDGLVTWTYNVTNIGNVTLYGVSVTDDQLGSIFCNDDVDGGALDIPPGETRTCTATGAAVVGQYVNTGSATGNPPTGTPPTDSDKSHYFGQESSIDIEKFTNGEDVETVPGPYIPVGDPVTWTYELENTGNVTLMNVLVTDSQLGSVTCDEGAIPDLAASDTFTCTTSGLATSGQYQNIGTVIATPPVGVNVTDSDFSYYFGQEPAVGITKYTNGDEAEEAPGPYILVGEPVVWTYLLENAGNVTLTGITVVDDQLGDVTCAEGPIPVLAPQGTPGSMFSCSTSGVAVSGQYMNMGTVTGTPPVGDDVTDSDVSHYFGETPSIDIEKATDGDDADTPPGPEMIIGAEVTWTYVVTNTGDVPLTNVTVVDDQLGPIDCDQGATPDLEPGASFTCEAVDFAQAGQYQNIGTASGTSPGENVVTDNDPSHYLGATPGIAIEKLTNGQDADDPPGPIIPVDATVTWTYRLQNNGNVTVTNVTVDDDQIGPVTCDQGPIPDLDPMDFFFCTTSGVATAGQYQNTGTITGSPAVGEDVSASDDSHYFGQDASIDIEKLTNGVNADTPAEGPFLPVGSDVTWTYELENTGNVLLTSVTVTDSILGPVSCDEGAIPDLAPADTFTCTVFAANAATAGQYQNVGTVTGTPPVGVAVSDFDLSHYFGQNASIVLAKSLDGNADEDGSGSITPNDTLTYSFAVSNDGNVTLDPFSVTDPLPGLSPISCGGLTSLAPAQMINCTATYVVTQADLDAGSIENTATASGTLPVGDPVTSVSSEDLGVFCALNTQCDDGNPCTDDVCSPGGTCTNPDNTDPCDDGMFCTTGETCSAGTCGGGAPTDCTAFDGECTTGVCNEDADQCEATNIDEGLSCDDGDSCLVGETCSSGTCGGGLAPDCSGTGDQCNDDATCNPAGAEGNCDTPGLPANEGLSCDDGDACLVGETCSSGTCAGGAPPDCSGTGDQCNADDTCDPMGAEGNCDTPGLPANEGGACDDGDSCLIGETCSSGICDGGAPPDCTGTGDQCNDDDTCDPMGAEGNCDTPGLPANEGGACDDGDDCLDGETCSSGVCAGGFPQDCTAFDDQCNVGVCNPGTGGCESQPANEGGPCDDGNPGNDPDFCNAGVCEGTPPPDPPTSSGPISIGGIDRRGEGEDSVNIGGSDSSTPEFTPLATSWSMVSKPAGSRAVTQGSGTGAGFTPDVPGVYEVQFVFRSNRVRAERSCEWIFLSVPTGSEATLSQADCDGAKFNPDLSGTYTLRVVARDGAVDGAPDPGTGKTGQGAGDHDETENRGAARVSGGRRR